MYLLFRCKEEQENSYLHQDEFQKTNIVLSLLYRDTAGVHYSSLSCWPLEMDEESDEEIPRGTDHKILGCQGYFHTRAYAHPHRHKKDDEMVDHVFSLAKLFKLVNIYSSPVYKTCHASSNRFGKLQGY
ncbi:UNVERIFIED_CONTAM: hypothetical protein NCL1_38847 [Trichonephila clavipes]